MARFIYRCHNGEHQIIDTTDGRVHRRIDADPRYPAHGGMMMRFCKRLNEGPHHGQVRCQ